MIYAQLLYFFTFFLLIPFNKVTAQSFSKSEELAVFSRHTNYDNNLSSIASDIKFIPLDTEPLINDFHISDIALSHEYIFLLNMKSISQYDNNGKYIRNIGRYGQGPNEYIHLTYPLQLDDKNKLIYVSDINRKRILVYTFEGKLEKTISPQRSSSIRLIDESTIALPQTIEDMNRTPYVAIQFMNYQGVITKSYSSSIHPVKIPTGERRVWGPGLSFLWEHTNNFYYLEYGNDTIFRIIKDTLLPVIVLTGENKKNREEHFYNRNEKKYSISSSIDRANTGIFESDRFIIFKLSNKEEIFYNVYDKSSKQFHRTFYKDAILNRSGTKKMNYFRDDLVSDIDFEPQYQSGGKAMALVPAHEIVEKRKEILNFISKNPTPEGGKLKTIIENMDEEDNPVLIIVTFK